MRRTHQPDNPGEYSDDDLFEAIERMSENEREFYERFQEKIRILKPELTLREVVVTYYGLMTRVAQILDRTGNYAPAPDDSSRGRFFMKRWHEYANSDVVSNVLVVYEYPREEYRTPQRVTFGPGTTIVDCIKIVESERLIHR